jgi:[phosphatase 2A protein]-leucine-carboxy methyltransferase
LAKYIEIDFPEVTAKKAMTIRKSKDLSEILGDTNIGGLPSGLFCCAIASHIHVGQANGGTSLHAPVYSLLPADLRLPPSETLASLLTSSSNNPSGPSSPPLLSPSLPTLLLFECVLVYMSPEASSSLVQWFVDYFSSGNQQDAVLGGIVYEMFGLGDSFGRVMLNNLKVLIIVLLSIIRTALIIGLFCRHRCIAVKERIATGR